MWFTQLYNISDATPPKHTHMSEAMSTLFKCNWLERFDRISSSQFKRPEKILMTHNSFSIRSKLDQCVYALCERMSCRERESESCKIILAISIWCKCVGLVTCHHSPHAAIAISYMKHLFEAYGTIKGNKWSITRSWCPSTLAKCEKGL